MVMKTGIVSDIHEDVVSLHKAFNLLEKHGCNEIICLGDTVGVCVHYNKYLDTRNAKECLRLVKQNCKYIIAGNHDQYAAAKVPEYRGGFHFQDNWYELGITKRRVLSNDKVWLYDDEYDSNLEEEDKQYISALPEYIIIENNGRKFLFSHFLFPDITGSAKNFPDSQNKLSPHFNFMKMQGCTTGICGHIHAEGMIRSIEPKNSVFNLIALPFKAFPFGEYKLNNVSQCIAAPAVAYTDRKNGVAIFDQDNDIFITIKI